MFSTYIIYSESLGKYYIGESEDVNRRLGEHNRGLYKGSYTKQASDWKLVLHFEFGDRSAARKMERFIKSQKSRKFIERLVSDRSLQTSLANRFGGHCPDGSGRWFGTNPVGPTLQTHWPLG